MRTSLCISSGGLYNTISGSSAVAHHLCKECGRWTVSNHFPSGNPERDSHWPGHGIYVTYTKRTVWILGIKSIRTSVYHPQTDGLVERFNRTLKSTVHKFVKEDAKNWDKWLEPLLFAVQEVPQASTGFSPFELLYGRQPRGVLDVIRESNSHSEIQYVMDLRAKLHTLGRLSMENLLQAQDRQSRLYNRGTRERQFTPGDKVLVLLPTSSSKLLTKWQFAAVCWCVFPLSGGIKGHARVGGNRRIA